MARTILVLLAISLLGPGVAHSAQSDIEHVDSYQFADIPWGSTLGTAREMLAAKGLRIAAEIVASDSMTSITARFMSEMGVEVEALLAFDAHYGLDFVIVVTTEGCFKPGTGDDQECLQQRYLASRGLLHRLYGEPDESVTWMYDIWTSASDGSTLELQRIIGMAYRSPNFRDNARRSSLF
jgi:hypothetical protein